MKEKQQKTELIYMMAFSIYTVFIFLSLAPICLLHASIVCGSAVLLAWILYFRQLHSHSNYAHTEAIITLIICFYHAVFIGNIDKIMLCFVGVTLMLGLLGIPRLLKIEAIFFLCACMYHTIRNLSQYQTPLEIFQLVTAILEFLLMLVLVNYVVCRRNETQEKMSEIVSRLQEAEHSKDEFLANVSHEIRTPLNTVCGMSELALREELPAQVSEEMFHIQTAGRLLQATVSDVLEFSELQTEKITLNEEEYHFTTVLNDVINMACAQNEEKQLELIVDCDAKIPTVMIGDSEKICRMITNLMSNAIKFTEQGCVSLRITARSEEYGVNLCITVKDTGIGMSQETVDKLFTSFNQMDTKKNRSQGGIGLGIAILHKVVELMHGFLTVESKKGQGSTFRIVIPQKVVDERPMLFVNDRAAVHPIIYCNLEQFAEMKTRDAYTQYIHHTAQRLDVPLTMCDTLQELKRQLSRKRYTHLFIDLQSYQEDTSFFRSLAKRISVTLIMDRREKEAVEGDFNYLYKPFSVMQIVDTLNGLSRSKRQGKSTCRKNCFIAPRASVLVVDDSPMNLKVIEGLLRPYEVHLATAPSGEDTLRLLDWARFDLIFMDHMMPKMDGVETLHELRKKSGEYFKKVPVVALTANAVGGAREMYLKEGFCDFIAKPIEISVLERVLKKHLADFIEYQGTWAGDYRYQKEKEPEYEAYDPKDAEKKREIDPQLMKEAEQLLEQAAEEEPLLQDTVPLLATDAEEIAEEQESMPQQAVQDNVTTNTTEEGFLIDMEQGLLYCGGELEDYVEILQIYYETGLDKKSIIQELYESENWKDYAIEVHALKSTSQSIGAECLYLLAKEQELAAKSMELDKVRKNHETLMNIYEAIMEEIHARWGDWT